MNNVQYSPILNIVQWSPLQAMMRRNFIEIIEILAERPMP